jgi:hypothetical protein
MIPESAARWFQSRRDELNQRFDRARKRFSSLNPERALNLIAQVIPPLIGEEPAAGELCLAVYDLVLLHCGRDSFGVQPGIETLLRETFPQIHRLLLLSPVGLPGALSNAVENMGARGQEFCLGLGALGQNIDTPEKLLTAGAVLAWRLGEARLRTQALAAAPALPARVTLDALGLSNWPEAAAPLALACLNQNAWQVPQSRLSETTLKAITAGTANVDELVQGLRETKSPPLTEWQSAGSFGDFAGFGGSFIAPPLLLNGGDRHTFLVRSGGDFFRVTADCFGSVCRPTQDPELEVRVPHAATLLARLTMRSTGDGNRLSADGTLTLGENKAQFPQMKGATSFVPMAGLVVYTTECSYRLRILTAMRPSL